MKPNLWIVLVIAFVSFTCKEDKKAEPETKDAEVSTTTWQDDALGLRLSFFPRWTSASINSEAQSKVQTVGRILRRRVVASVVPRIIITREPLTPELAELTDGSLFNRILNDLRKLKDRPQTRIVRTAWSTRFVDAHAVGDLELAYATVNADGKEQQIVQRSWVLRRKTTTPPALVTLSASYLTQDALQVGPEVDSILSTLKITPLTTAAP